jgi:thiol-disulfide isomerase/thioredoxin
MDPRAAAGNGFENDDKVSFRKFEPKLAHLFDIKTGKNTTFFDPQQEKGPSLVHFWATWCTACVQELPALIQFAKERSWIKVILISMDETVEAPKKFLDTRNLPGQVEYLFDPGRNLAFHWGTRYFPETHLMDKGQVFMQLLGSQAWTPELAKRVESKMSQPSL